MRIRQVNSVKVLRIVPGTFRTILLFYSRAAFGMELGVFFGRRCSGRVADENLKIFQWLLM